MLYSLLNSFVNLPLSNWYSKTLDFGNIRIEGEQLKKQFEENMINIILENWKYLIIIFKIFFFLLFFIFLFAGERELFKIRGSLIVIFMIVLHGLQYFIRKSRGVAKNAGMVIIIVFGWFIAEINVKLISYRYV